MTTEQEQRSSASRQRLGWTILLGSFAICMILTIAVPVTINAYLQNATKNLTVSVQANQGIVGIETATDVRQAVLVGQPGQTIEPNDGILTDATATALVSIFPPDSERLLSRLQVYGNTTVTLEQADTPRFAFSDVGQELHLDLERGRMRLTVPEMEERPLHITITTPQSKVTIETPGQYSISATNAETQVTIQDGLAHVVALDHYVDLDPGERTVVPTDGIPSIPLGTERNLVKNGDFATRWDRWQQYAWEIELSDQPAGQIDVAEVDGVSTLYVRREGLGHADVKVRQSINRDVNDFSTLSLQLTFRILGQSLGVCGVQGSECPLFVKINYLDQTGATRTWQHGFYGAGTANEDGAPDTCAFCGVVQSPHDLVTLGQVQFFELNLLEEVARLGVPPISLIESVELVASGHSFDVEVLEVALIVDE
jgi:hypothetical protein